MGSFWFEYDEEGDAQTFSFDGDNVSIGRDQSSDFVLDHPTVSRQHALVIDDGDGRFRLVVLSRGGLTAVDGERIEGETNLYDGTRIHFGKLAFRFHSDQAPAQPAGGDRGPARGQPQPQGGTPSPAGSSTGGTGAPMAQTEGPDGDGRSSHTVNSSERAGIESWDEIARSAEIDEQPRPDASRASHQGGTPDEEVDALQPPERGAEGGEQTDPKIVVVGLIGIVALLAYSYWPQGGGSGSTAGSPLEKKAPEQLVRVDCLSEQKCLKEANASYRVGIEYLEKQDSEVANLFEGYKRLLESQAYLEKAEVGSVPKALSDLDPRIERAEEKLDRIFRNYQVKYRSAQKNGQPREMAAALETIQRYFPDKRAPEHQWARERILEMKEKGTYPSGY